MLNALLVGNPGSGTGKDLKALHVPGHWIYEPWTVTAHEVKRADLLALFGGDGTMQITLSQLLKEMTPEEFPPIAILPFGTTNMNAGDLNHSRNRRQAVECLTRAIETGRFDSFERGLVRVQQGNSLQHGFFFGLGVIAQVIERWNEERKPGVLANQLRSLWAIVTGLSGVSSRNDIRVNGAHQCVYGLLATTLDRLLYGSRPYWGFGSPGDLKITWISADAAHLLRHAPAVLRGLDTLANQPGYESYSEDQAVLEFSGPYVLDGEVFQSTGGQLTISRSSSLQWVRL